MHEIRLMCAASPGWVSRYTTPPPGSDETEFAVAVWVVMGDHRLTAYSAGDLGVPDDEIDGFVGWYFVG